jgi:hypothetical protein
MDGSFALLPEKSSRSSAAASLLALALELLIWLLVAVPHFSFSPQGDRR